MVAFERLAFVVVVAAAAAFVEGVVAAFVELLFGFCVVVCKMGTVRYGIVVPVNASYDIPVVLV